MGIGLFSIYLSLDLNSDGEMVDATCEVHHPIPNLISNDINLFMIQKKIKYFHLDARERNEVVAGHLAVPLLKLGHVDAPVVAGGVPLAAAIDLGEGVVPALVRWCVGALARWCVGALVRW